MFGCAAWVVIWIISISLLCTLLCLSIKWNSFFHELSVISYKFIMTFEMNFIIDSQSLVWHFGIQAIAYFSLIFGQDTRSLRNFTKQHTFNQGNRFCWESNSCLTNWILSNNFSKPELIKTKFWRSKHNESPLQRANTGGLRKHLSLIWIKTITRRVKRHETKNRGRMYRKLMACTGPDTFTLS